MHNYLETLPFWKELTDDQKQLLSTHIIERSFKRGTFSITAVRNAPVWK